jgi:hypothetical protein
MTKFFSEARGAHDKNKSAESTAMKTQSPIAAEDDHRVVPFRPRSTLQRRTVAGGGPPVPLHRREEAQPDILDLSRYERPREQPDDFRHRILANIAAIAFTVALTAIGIWLAMSIADLRKTQDCLLTGRRDCARLITEPYTP